MFELNTDDLVRRFLPANSADPASVDAGTICAVAGTLLDNLAFWIIEPDDLDECASFFAALLVSVEKQIDGR